MADISAPPQPQDLPVVLVHRIPVCDIGFAKRINNHFTLLDPLLYPSESTHSFLSRHASSIRALLTVGPKPVTSEILSLLPELGVIVGSSAGLDHIDLRECRRRGILVANCGNAAGEDGADYAIALLIDVLRGVSAGDRFIRAGLWPKHGAYPLGSKLGGRRVGIVGLGSIGSEIAKRIVAFGCSVAYTSRKKKAGVPYTYYENARDLAAASDVLVVSCALTKQTHHIVDKDVMKALGKEGVIVNVGRGPLIDEKELVQFLLRGEIAGAGLDVFENEPAVPEELRKMDNVVLSPHLAVQTPEAFIKLEDMIIGNFEAFFSNKPLLSQVLLD